MDINHNVFLPYVDVTADAFVAELRNTPLGTDLGVAGLLSVYSLLSAARHPDGRYLSVAFSLGMQFSENQYNMAVDSIEHKYQTRNWGMRRSVASPLFKTGGADSTHADIVSTPRGQFVKYLTWLDGVKDFVFSLTSASFVYRQKGLETIAEINGTWAPKGDQDNDPQAKSRNVATVMERLSRQPQEQPKMVTVALSAGHHNKQGGDPKEVEQTGNLTRAIGDALTARGITVVHLTPDRGMGTTNLGLDEVAVKVNSLNPLPAVYLEPHTEGGGGLGIFAIYPDWGNDVDTDVRDRLGPAIVKAVSAATGLGLGGVGNSGLMSEKRTGVGAGGDRLGIFRVTAPVASTVTRLIVEYGAHDRPGDLALVNRPDFYAKAGAATADAIAAFLGVSVNKVPVTPGTDPISQALVSWYRGQSADLQGNLGNQTFYEVNIDWTGIYPQLANAARGIRGEYFAGWYNPATSQVEPIHLDNYATLRTTGKISPRK